MKIIKEAAGGEGAALTAGDLELIGALARRPLSQEEVYTFSASTKPSWSGSRTE